MEFSIIYLFFLTLPQHKFSIWLFYVLVNFPFNHSVQNTSGEPLHKFCSQEKKLFSQSWTPNLSFFKFFLVLKHLSRGLEKLQMKLCLKRVRKIEFQMRVIEFKMYVCRSCHYKMLWKYVDYFLCLLIIDWW